MSIDHGKVLAAATSLDGLADVIRKHGTCAPLALNQVADNIRALAQPAEAVELPTPYHYADGGKGEPLFTANQVRAAVAVATDAAQGAVAPFAYGADLTPGDYDMEHSVWLLRPGESVPAGCTPLYTHPQAAPAQGDGWKLCYSAVIHALAAIVNVRCPNKLFDLDAIPRGPVMEQVILIREAMDRFGKVHAAAPSQEGE